MGKHSAARSRRTPSVAAAAVVAPYALLLAAGGDVSLPAPSIDADVPDQIVDEPVSRSVEIVAAAPTAIPSADTIVQASLSSAPAQFAPASRYRVYNREAERVLPVGLAPEGGLQVRTILASRSISAMFPEIQSIGGVRPDGLRWHPERSGARCDDPQPEQRGGHSARKQDRLVRAREREEVRIAGRDLAWRLLHAPRARAPAATATMTTSTSPRPVADSPAAMRSTPAEPRQRDGRR